MSDGLYRYTANNLLRSVHRGLGWPVPERLFSAGFEPVYPTSYPDATLQKAMGQFFSDTQAESKNSQFQGMLKWESVHGLCAKPTDPAVASDWIDDVMTAAAGFGGPGGPLTVGDLVVVVKDWLLSDGTIESAAPEGLAVAEDEVLEDYFGVSLSTEASAVADLDDKLRGLCGVWLQSAQYWIGGLAMTGLGPEPRLRVCTSGPCTYQEICNALKPAVDDLLPDASVPPGVTCGTDSVTAGPVIELVAVEEALCPPGLCGRIPIDPSVLGECLRDPARCPREPPSCDPRCRRVDCCGGPLPPLERAGYLVAWVDEARVGVAEGVLILRAGTGRWEPLERGGVLQEGDLLMLRGGSRLELRTALGRVTTGRKGLADKDQTGPRLVMVSGPGALARRQPREALPRLDRARIDRLMTKGWWQWGEAGRPLTVEERRGFVGFEEELAEEARRQQRQSSSKNQTD
jgi:hypothetical protein